jgi:hypothetical protein
MLRWLALCATLATAQLPPGIQMGAPGGDDEVLTHNAEELTDETFEERRMEHELFVVLFRDKTEQQAKQMEKEFELAASDLVERSFSSAVALGMVDLTEAKGAAKKAGVTEGPVIEVWRRGKKLPLGPSSGDARSIVNFVSYLTAPVSKKLESSADVNAWLRDKGTTVVLGIFADACAPPRGQRRTAAPRPAPHHRRRTVRARAAPPRDGSTDARVCLACTQRVRRTMCG